MLCPCPRDHLCPDCLETCFGQMAGPAALRGTRWAERVARHVDRSLTWPRTDKAHGIALRLVFDLTRDERLRERLAVRCEEQAERRWRDG